MNISDGSIVSIEMVDGTIIEECLFIKEERGFLLFLVDGKITVTRDSSIKSIKEIYHE